MDGAVYLHSNIKYSITTKVSVFALLSQAKKEERRKRAQEMLKQANIRNVSTSFDSSTHTTTVSRMHFNCRINNSITYRLSYSIVLISFVPRLWCGRRKESLVYTVHTCVKFPWQLYILFHYAKSKEISVYATLQSHTPYVTHTGS